MHIWRHHLLNGGEVQCDTWTGIGIDRHTLNKDIALIESETQLSQIRRNVSEYESSRILDRGKYIIVLSHLFHHKYINLILYLAP